MLGGRCCVGWNPRGLTLRRPSRAVQVKAFAAKAMKTKLVRVDTELNKQLWSNGIRNVRPGPPTAAKPCAGRGRDPEPARPCLCATRRP